MLGAAPRAVNAYRQLCSTAAMQERDVAKRSTGYIKKNARRRRSACPRLAPACAIAPFAAVATLRPAVMHIGCRAAVVALPASGGNVAAIVSGIHRYGLRGCTVNVIGISVIHVTSAKFSIRAMVFEWPESALRCACFAAQKMQTTQCVGAYTSRITGTMARRSHARPQAHEDVVPHREGSAVADTEIT